MTRAGSQATRGGKRAALVIGNSDYQQAAPLANASNDAAAVSRALKRLGWDVTLRENLNRNSIQDALEGFQETTEDCAAALFFFAGHGINIWGQNYLLPVDARIEFEDHVHQRSCFLGNILHGMVERAGISIALIDACQENPFQRSITRSLNPDYRSGGRSGSGLAHVKAPQGAFVAFAASPGELAYDTPGRHSPFTSALLESFSSEDGEISAIFRRVQERVHAATGGAQRPWMHSDLPGPFYMSADTRAAKPSAPPALSSMKQPGHTISSISGKTVTAKLRVARQQSPEQPEPAAVAQPLQQPVTEAPPSIVQIAPMPPSAPMVNTELTINDIGEVAGQLALAIGAAEWERLRDSRDIGQLMRFAEHFPGYYGECARERVQILTSEVREHSNWLWAGQHDTIEAYQRFLAVWPQGRYANTALNRMAELENLQGQATGRVQAQAPMPMQVATQAPLPSQPRVVGHTQQTRGQTPGQSQAQAQVPVQSLPGTQTAAERTVRNHRSQTENFGHVQARTSAPAQTRMFEAGQIIRDGDFAPELVIVPPGAFIMGSSEENALPSEMPEHRVVIPRALAVARYPVTFDEWDAAFEAGGVLHRPSDKRWGRGRRPVINVSWNDAQGYVEWLSEVTGHEYRLLSEAEWEYCCRSGTTTSYSTGSHLSRRAAHCSFDHWGCAGKTVEVGLFEANRFGLHDMHGNVSEWVEDTWCDTHNDAPDDGSPFIDSRQSAKVVRGGSWTDVPRSLRSSSRNRLKAASRNDHTGFRVARILT